MSIALSTARASVRQLIRAVDLTDSWAKGFFVDQAISDNYQLVSGKLQMPLAWVTLSALTAGTAAYALTSGNAKEFHSIGLFRLASTLHLVEKVSEGYLATLRSGNTNALGEPIALAILEAAPAAVGTMETTFTVYPAPDQAYTLEGLASEVPGVISADTDKIQLGQLAQRAIEYGAAAQLLRVMPDEVAARLQVDRSVAERYERQGEDFRIAELTRVSRQRTGRFANTSSSGRW